MTIRSLVWVSIVSASAIALVAETQVPTARERRLGFTPEAFARQRPFENRFTAAVRPASISDGHRAITRRPHRAGTDGAREVADYLRRQLTDAGLDVEVTEYLAYLSEPQSVRIDVVEPVHESLATMETADARDPDTAHRELDPAFIAYSPSGNIKAPVVYANYGLPADYEELKAAGVDVKGRIVLVRYARSHRAVKVYTAERAGAAAVILYSDPADDGAARGATWPDGMWRAPQFIQRGNAKYSWYWHGDPLTPGVGASRDAKALDPATAPTLPKIPVAVLSAAEAQKLLQRMSGPEAPAAFRGRLPVTYRLGPGATVVHLQLAMRNERLPIRNVLGRIRGASAADRWIILGTHHDAWTFGGIDPGSSAAVILEVARRLGQLRQAGWRPSRSIVFAFWDAEEYGLVGSTEFAEDRARDLQERAVVYINSDMYTRGRLVAGGVPSLRDFVAELTRDVAAPGAPPALGAPTVPDAPRASDRASAPELSPWQRSRLRRVSGPPGHPHPRARISVRRWLRLWCLSLDLRQPPVHGTHRRSGLVARRRARTPARRCGNATGCRSGSSLPLLALRQSNPIVPARGRRVEPGSPDERRHRHQRPAASGDENFRPRKRR
jgi:N-acetylated-alpha-linked acidic dipeptidase